MNKSDKCYGCGTNLEIRREKFEWLISRGYETKDAAAQVLHSPGGMLPVNSCCVVGLETNLDPEKGIKERQEIKDAILRERVANSIQTTGIDPTQREEVDIFVTSPDGEVPGSFILVDFPENLTPQLLAGHTDPNGIRTLGFPITNIAFISKALSESEKFRWNNSPLTLWSGKIKIVPAVFVNGKLEPGIMWIRKVANPQDIQRMTDVIDKTLLGAEIISYRKVPVQGAITTGEQEVLTLRKKLPKDLIG